MPQEFHAVKCYKCETFQVQIVKKTNKFDCKICGERQSVKKEYGRGTGKDCRLHVQKLNELRLQNVSRIKQESVQLCTQSEMFNDGFELNVRNLPVVQNSMCSKWFEHLRVPEETYPSSSEEETLPEFANFTFQRPNKRKIFSNSGFEKVRSLSKNTSDIKHGSYLNDAKEIQNNCNLTQQENNNFSPTKSTLVEDNKSSKKLLPVVKKSKWTDFVSTENIREKDDDCELNVPPNDKNMCVIDIFKTDHENFDDILDL